VGARTNQSRTLRTSPARRSVFESLLDRHSWSRRMPLPHRILHVRSQPRLNLSGGGGDGGNLLRTTKVD